MAEITAALVKELREKTGAGMMDCKRALTETGGDLEQAIDWLRKKGLAAAAKKSGRVAAEGLVGVASVPLKAAMIEVNAETDFVARNDSFQTSSKPWPGWRWNRREYRGAEGGAVSRRRAAVAEQLTHLVATIGENMTLRRARVISLPKGVVATYVHQPLRPGLGDRGDRGRRGAGRAGRAGDAGPPDGHADRRQPAGGGGRCRD